jgi:gliding motility-associated protein GldM
MAGKNETPRQRMISMMYLVLTAMLALNVTREVLDSFVVIDKGLEATNKNFGKHNDDLYTQFDLAKSVDPNRVTSNWEKAQLVKKEAASLTAFIDKIKNELISKTEGIPEQAADTLQMANIESKDNTDVSTFIMIGNKEDGSTGKSRELKNKLEAYKKMLGDYILPIDRKKVEINLDTHDPPPNDENANWEVYNFSERPLVACITLLSKFKNDIKTAESNVVDYLLKQVDKGSLKFDTVAAKVIPQSNYVLLGEEYKADVFLAAFNKTRNPEIKVGNFDEKSKTFIGAADALTVERGLGKYNIRTTREGFVSYAGSIKVVAPSGEEMMFPFKSEYIVAKPALTVSADAMNVFYADLENPISISVPGIPNERLSVSISNGTITPKGNGKFIVKVRNGTDSKISVTATMENGGKRNMGISTFRIRQVPQPTVKFGKLVTDGALSKGEINNITGVIANYDNFIFNVPCKVLSCTISVPVNGGFMDYKLSSNMISSANPSGLDTRLKQMRRGERILITDVIVSHPSGVPKPASGLTVKVR